jgi:hypothetical protein
MGAAILEVARDSEGRQRFAENAEAAFATHFSFERMLDGYMDLYCNSRIESRSLL